MRIVLFCFIIFAGGTVQLVTKATIRHTKPLEATRHSVEINIRIGETLFQSSSGPLLNLHTHIYKHTNFRIYTVCMVWVHIRNDVEFCAASA